MNLIVPDWIDAPKNIGAFCTTRAGGISPAPYDDGAGSGGLNLGTHVNDLPQNVQHNRALLRTLLPSEPAWLNQVHGTEVVDAAAVSSVPDADASFTMQAGTVCAIQTADCLPVLLCDVAGSMVAAAHAGWRGLASGVLENTVKKMRGNGAGEILAWLGPAIGPQRFEVGGDVFQAFVERHPRASEAFAPISNQPGKYLADIYVLARIALTKVRVERVYGGGMCTVSEQSRFFSYRRDQVTGRMASLIWIKQS